MIEINKSREERSRLKGELVSALMRWQEATQLFDETVGERLGLTTAERHCMSFLVEGPQPAGAIAETIGLTPAAVTSLVDRLEARGFVARQRNEADRRQVLVAPTEAAIKIGERYYGQIAQVGEAMLDTMSTAELAVVKNFITVALELQQRQIERIRNDKAKPPAGLKPRRS